MTEAQFQRQVLWLATRCGWRCAHFRPAMTRAGKWVTPVAANGAGFPDLVLVRDRVVYVELKSESGKLRPEQEAWRAALQAAGADVRLWRPTDWDEITLTLGPMLGATTGDYRISRQLPARGADPDQD